MKHGSLFSGIGGFDLAAQWMGWENVFHCEIAEFPLKVLQHYWPNAISYENIIETDFTKHRGHIDVISGGSPCQPYSLAGKRLGKEDARHLWPEMLRCIREIQPKWVVGENVFGIVNWSGGLVFDEVQSDLEAQGYEVQAYVLPACAVNAPHRRDRVWFVAYSDDTRTGDKRREFNGQGRESGSNRKPSIYENGAAGTSGHNTASANDGIAKNTNQDGRGSEFGQKESGERQFRNTCAGNNEPISSNDGEIRLTPDTTRKQNQRHGQGRFYTQPAGADEQGFIALPTSYRGHRKTRATDIAGWERFPTTEPTIRRGDDGLSGRLDGITFSKWRNESIKAYGNAVVPQVVYEIFKAIEEWENKY